MVSAEPKKGSVCFYVIPHFILRVLLIVVEITYWIKMNNKKYIRIY